MNKNSRKDSAIRKVADQRTIDGHKDSLDAYDLYERTMEIIERVYGRRKKYTYSNASPKDFKLTHYGTYATTQSIRKI